MTPDSPPPPPIENTSTQICVQSEEIIVNPIKFWSAIYNTPTNRSLTAQELTTGINNGTIIDITETARVNVHHEDYETITPLTWATRARGRIQEIMPDYDTPRNSRWIEYNRLVNTIANLIMPLHERDPLYDEESDDAADDETQPLHATATQQTSFWNAVEQGMSMQQIENDISNGMISNLRERQRVVDDEGNLHYFAPLEWIKSFCNLLDTRTNIDKCRQKQNYGKYRTLADLIAQKIGGSAITTNRDTNRSTLQRPNHSSANPSVIPIDIETDTDTEENCCMRFCDYFKRFARK